MTGDVTIIGGRAHFDLSEVSRRIAPALRAAGAERAVVFGSWARGEADGYSDIDVAVVLDTDRPFLDRAGLLREVLDALPMGVDLLVYTPEEFEEGMRRGVGVFRSIEREGVTLHG